MLDAEGKRRARLTISRGLQSAFILKTAVGKIMPKEISKPEKLSTNYTDTTDYTDTNPPCRCLYHSCKASRRTMIMKGIYLNLIFVVSMCLLVSCTSNETQKPVKTGEVVRLPPFIDRYYWKSFNVTPDSPLSPDGRYRLIKVTENGWVELSFSPNPSESKMVIAKPMPKQFEKGEGFPLVVVLEADFKAQTAVLKMLLTDNRPK